MRKDAKEAPERREALQRWVPRTGIEEGPRTKVILSGAERSRRISLGLQPAGHWLTFRRRPSEERYFHFGRQEAASAQNDRVGAGARRPSPVWGGGLKPTAMLSEPWDPRPFDRPTSTPPLARISQCAVKRHQSSAGANPAWQLSLLPVAIGAVAEVTKRLKPSVQRVARRLGERAGRNASER